MAAPTAAGDAVRRLDVGDAEGVFRLRHRLVEQEVGAAVDEDRQQPSSSATGPSAGVLPLEMMPVNRSIFSGELHAAKLFDVGVGAGGFVGRDGLDLALAEEAALRVDLLGRQDVALRARLAEHRGRAGEERHVAGLERRVGDVSFDLFRRCCRVDHGRRQVGATAAPAAMPTVMPKRFMKSRRLTGGTCLGMCSTVNSP